MKKFSVVAIWWGLFTVVWWGVIGIWVFMQPDTGDNGIMPITPRGGAEIIVRMYGLWIYIALSLLIIGVKSFLVSKKKK